MPIACSTSALTGADGSLWFTQPGTSVCLLFTDFKGHLIYAGADHEFVVGNKVVFTAERGATLPPGIIPGLVYYVETVDDPSAGYLRVATTPGGPPISVPIADVPMDNAVIVCIVTTGGDYDNSDVTNGTDSICTDAPGYDSPSFAPGVVDYDNADVRPRYLVDVPLGAPDPNTTGHIRVTAQVQVVCGVREFSIEFTRSELDVTSLPCDFEGDAFKYAAFRRVQPGYVEGTGTMSVYFSEDQESVANRLLQSVLRRSQDGAIAKLYVNTVTDGAGGINDAASLYIESGVALTNMSLSSNPDDAVTAELSFSIANPKDVLGAAIG